MYSYENYHKVKAALEERRNAARAAAEARNEELRMRSPEIRKIDEELSGTGLLIFKTACSGGDIAPIRKRNEELTRRRTEIITSLGLPADYTDVKYSCDKCSDTGYKPSGTMCTCLREDLIRATIASSGIGNLIDKQSFDNFRLDYYKDSPEVSERMKNKFAAITFSSMYALTAFGIVNAHNSMWIDVLLFLPLVILGLEKLINERKYKLYTIVLAVSIISNFYIGFMLCIFIAIYSVYYYFD